MGDQLDGDIQPASKFVVVDGIKVHYKRTGTSTVLLLHGSASSLRGVEAVALELTIRPSGRSPGGWA
ncbi:alpha/beta fold hydrolase [Nocardia sp. NPDC004573]